MYEFLSKEESESICRRCGICCGSEDNDPCENLQQDKKGKYYCPIYKIRFGRHKTVNGTEIRCIPIEQALKIKPELRKKCAYAKIPAKDRKVAIKK